MLAIVIKFAGAVAEDLNQQEALEEYIEQQEYITIEDFEVLDGVVLIYPMFIDATSPQEIERFEGGAVAALLQVVIDEVAKKM